MSRIGRLGAPPLDTIVRELNGVRGSADIRLACAGACGLIAFRGGELVHASVAPRSERDAARSARDTRAVTGPLAVYAMLAWPTGSFAIVETSEAIEATIFAAPNDLVLEGLRRLVDGAEIRRRLPPSDAILTIARSPSGVIATPLTSVELTLLAEIDGRSRLDATFERSVLGLALARQVALRLIAIGLVDARPYELPPSASAYDLRALFPFRRTVQLRRSRRIRSRAP